METTDRLTVGERGILERWKSSRDSKQEPKLAKIEREKKTDERRLVALMFTDMVGYTALCQKDEALAIEILEQHRSLLRPIFRKYNGVEIDTIGDAFFVEFPSALEAVKCSLDIQSAVIDFNTRRPLESKFLLRIGIHLGDTIHKDEKVYGDAVNIASRIHELSAPGSVCISEEVYLQVKDKLLDSTFVDLGKKHLKNVQSEVGVYSLKI